MAEKNPDPKPAPGAADIPVGKLVGGKPEKPAARPKPKPGEAAAAKPAPPALSPPASAKPTGSGTHAVAPPARPVAAAPAGEYDVELVAVPCPPPGEPHKPRDKRSLFELDRRDFIMLGTGVGGSLIAVLTGLVVAKALQRKSSDD